MHRHRLLKEEFSMSNNVLRYNKPAVFLHWLIAIGIFGMFALGWYASDLPKEAPKQAAYDLFDWGIYTWQLAEPISPRSFYFNLHKSLGLTVFAIILIRIVWRFINSPPELLDTYKKWEKTLATFTHRTLYVLLVAVPLSGVIMSVYSKYGIKWFGLPFIKGLDNNPMRELYKEAHEVIGIILLVLVAIHILGALKHKFIDKDNTMKRMSF